MVFNFRSKLACLLLGLCIVRPACAAPSFDQVKADFISSESLLLDRHGEVLHRLRADPTVRRGQWVALEDVSPALRTAMVLSEDKRFYQHSGVDWHAVGAAAWGNLWNSKTRGASTITMQLVGLVNADLQRGHGGRTLLQKFGQAASARMLDGQWHKHEILEAYLNLVPYRGELVGIDALSRTLFGKAAHGLDAREAAIAAALVRSPNATPKAVAQRACGVLAQMQKVPRSMQLCDSLSLFAAGVMQRKAWAPSDGQAPHLARRLLAGQKAGTQLRSSVSAPLQRFVVQQLQQQLHELQGRNVHDGAVLVLDNATGEVLAYVGSNASTSSNVHVDGVQAVRQPGSTLKPFLYAQAVAEKRLTAASLLDDSPAAIATPSGLYIPQNYDRHFKGWVSLRTALGNSLNVPAVRAVGMVGVNNFARQLRQMGIRLSRTGDYYGYSLALGSPEISLWQLTNAYRTLANGGRYSAVRTTPAAGAPASQPVLHAAAAYIVGHILADNNARILTFGANNVLQTRFWSAVKTGTSKDMRDNWALGYSQRYTVGVWVGNAKGSPMWDVSGTSGAAPVWAAVMHYLHSTTPSHAPQPPDGVVARTVRFIAADARQSSSPSPTPLEPARTEWFVSGTEQTVFTVPRATVLNASDTQTGNAAGATRILSPSDGTILALDPDIPPRNQRLMLRSSVSNAHWWMDGRRMGQGATLGWLPWPGRHRIELRSASGHTLDTVHIEVRGAGVKMDTAKRQ